MPATHSESPFNNDTNAASHHDNIEQSNFFSQEHSSQQQQQQQQQHQLPLMPNLHDHQPPPQQAYSMQCSHSGVPQTFRQSRSLPATPRVASGATTANIAAHDNINSFSSLGINNVGNSQCSINDDSSSLGVGRICLESLSGNTSTNSSQTVNSSNGLPNENGLQGGGGGDILSSSTATKSTAIYSTSTGSAQSNSNFFALPSLPYEMSPGFSRLQESGNHVIINPSEATSLPNGESCSANTLCSTILPKQSSFVKVTTQDKLSNGPFTALPGQDTGPGMQYVSLSDKSSSKCNGAEDTSLYVTCLENSAGFTSVKGVPRTVGGGWDTNKSAINYDQRWGKNNSVDNSEKDHAASESSENLINQDKLLDLHVSSIDYSSLPLPCTCGASNSGENSSFCCCNSSNGDRKMTGQHSEPRIQSKRSGVGPSCGNGDNIPAALSTMGTEDSVSADAETRRSGRTRCVKDSPMEDICEDFSDMGSVPTPTDGMSDSDAAPTEVVSLLQEEVLTLQRQCSGLRQELHHSRLLCAQLSAQLEEAQYSQPPGFVAEIVGELHAAQKIRDESLMARIKLANEERDAVLKAYTPRQPAASHSTSGMMLTGPSPEQKTGRGSTSAPQSLGDRDSTEHHRGARVFSSSPNSLNAPSDQPWGPEASPRLSAEGSRNTTKCQTTANAMSAMQRQTVASSGGRGSLDAFTPGFNPLRMSSAHVEESPMILDFSESPFGIRSSSSKSSVGTLTSTPRLPIIPGCQHAQRDSDEARSTLLPSFIAERNAVFTSTVPCPPASSCNECSNKLDRYSPRYTDGGGALSAFEIYSKVKLEERNHSNVLIEHGLERLGIHPGSTREVNRAASSNQGQHSTQQQQRDHALRSIPLPPGYTLQQITLQQHSGSSSGGKKQRGAPSVVWAIVPVNRVGNTYDDDAAQHGRMNYVADDSASLDLLPTKLNYDEDVSPSPRTGSCHQRPSASPRGTCCHRTASDDATFALDRHHHGHRQLRQDDDKCQECEVATSAQHSSGNQSSAVSPTTPFTTGILRSDDEKTKKAAVAEGNKGLDAPSCLENSSNVSVVAADESIARTNEELPSEARGKEPERGDSGKGETREGVEDGGMDESGQEEEDDERDESESEDSFRDDCDESDPDDAGGTREEEQEDEGDSSSAGEEEDEGSYDVEGMSPNHEEKGRSRSGVDGENCPEDDGGNDEQSLKGDVDGRPREGSVTACTTSDENEEQIVGCFDTSSAGLSELKQRSSEDCSKSDSDVTLKVTADCGLMSLEHDTSAAGGSVNGCKAIDTCDGADSAGSEAADLELDSGFLGSEKLEDGPEEERDILSGSLGKGGDEAKKAKLVDSREPSYLESSKSACAEFHLEEQTKHGNLDGALVKGVDSSDVGAIVVAITSSEEEHGRHEELQVVLKACHANEMISNESHAADEGEIVSEKSVPSATVVVPEKVPSQGQCSEERLSIVVGDSFTSEEVIDGLGERKGSLLAEDVKKTLVEFMNHILAADPIRDLGSLRGLSSSSGHLAQSSEDLDVSERDQCYAYNTLPNFKKRAALKSESKASVVLGVSNTDLEMNGALLSVDVKKGFDYDKCKVLPVHEATVEGVQTITPTPTAAQILHAAHDNEWNSIEPAAKAHTEIIHAFQCIELPSCSTTPAQYGTEQLSTADTKGSILSYSIPVRALQDALSATSEQERDEQPSESSSFNKMERKSDWAVLSGGKKQPFQSERNAGRKQACQSPRIGGDKVVECVDEKHAAVDQARVVRSLESTVEFPDCTGGKHYFRNTAGQLSDHDGTVIAKEGGSSSAGGREHSDEVHRVTSIGVKANSNTSIFENSIKELRKTKSRTSALGNELEKKHEDSHAWDMDKLNNQNKEKTKYINLKQKIKSSKSKQPSSSKPKKTKPSNKDKVSFAKYIKNKPFSFTNLPHFKSKSLPQSVLFSTDAEDRGTPSSTVDATNSQATKRSRPSRVAEGLPSHQRSSSEFTFLSGQEYEKMRLRRHGNGSSANLASGTETDHSDSGKATSSSGPGVAGAMKSVDNKQKRTSEWVSGIGSSFQDSKVLSDHFIIPEHYNERPVDVHIVVPPPPNKTVMARGFSKSEVEDLFGVSEVTPPSTGTHCPTTAADNIKNALLERGRESLHQSAAGRGRRAPHDCASTTTTSCGGGSGKSRGHHAPDDLASSTSSCGSGKPKHGKMAKARSLLPVWKRTKSAGVLADNERDRDGGASSSSMDGSLKINGVSSSATNHSKKSSSNKVFRRFSFGFFDIRMFGGKHRDEEHPSKGPGSESSSLGVSGGESSVSGRRGGDEALSEVVNGAGSGGAGNMSSKNSEAVAKSVSPAHNTNIKPKRFSWIW